MKTTSYELSKKLADIGFKAETEKAFDNEGTLISCHKKICILREKSSNPKIYGLPAYDLETILETLPTEINVGKEKAWLSLDFCTYRASIGYGSDGENYTNKLYFSKKENESLVDAAARLLILLQEKGLINFKKDQERENETQN
jgi:hypothetical protein